MRVQDAVAESFQSIASPLLAGRLVRNIEVSTTPAFIEHGLGREPLGFFVTDVRADISVWRGSTNPAPTRLLALVASASSTISIYVF